MSNEKSLEFGETPWQHLSNEELQREVERLFSALNGAACALRLLKRHENSGFWGTEGTGGSSSAHAEEALDLARHGHGDGDIYRAYFRYANDLLFTPLPGEIHGRWAICPTCGQMTAPIGKGETASFAGRKCSESGLNLKCDGILRLITWEDLKPQTDEPAS